MVQLYIILPGCVGRGVEIPLPGLEVGEVEVAGGAVGVPGMPTQ